jgi:MoaA/NifB/PqqE/SkfB family radical SAM enzyme
LSCRICSPVFSSQWHSEVARHPDKYPVKFTRIKNKWTDDIDSNLWQDIVKIGKNIRYITFTGGEPLLDKSHIHLLKYLIDIGVSDKTYLHYNTNGTVYADNLIPLWNKFKTVELSFSIDNLFDKFEYERYGAVWHKVVDNIIQYRSLDAKIYNFNVYSTVSALNILDSYETYNYFKSNQIPIHLSILDSPEELSIRVLDSNTKKCIAKKLRNIDDKDFQIIIEPILTYMQPSIDGYSVKNFVDYLSRTDNVRKQNFKELYKELTLMLEI